MSIEFFFRLVGMVVMAILGWQVGITLSGGSTEAEIRYVLVLSLAGAALGLLLTPWVTTRPFRAIRQQLRQLPAQQLVAATLGLIVGLIIAALLAFPISLLPPPFGQVLPFLGALCFAYLGSAVMVMRQKDIFAVFSGRWSARERGLGSPSDSRPILLDTSVIIDGRIADIAQTGFISGELLVPRFVLNELQYIADSPDRLRRNRGRRGMEVLRILQEDAPIPVRITDMDIEGTRQVDDKLILLAKRLHCPIMTNDYNLNRVAELQGVQVMNINELANAVRAIYLPGETLEIEVIQEGKEIGQGVGYLDDGTMVVVESGRDYIGKTIPVIVTKVLQTAAGRMIFARPHLDSSPQR